MRKVGSMKFGADALLDEPQAEPGLTSEDVRCGLVGKGGLLNEA